jgi:hypothetical protein
MLDTLLVVLRQGGTLSKAEAEEKMAEIVGASLVEGLRSANWKDRLGSIENLLVKAGAQCRNTKVKRCCQG